MKLRRSTCLVVLTLGALIFALTLLPFVIGVVVDLCRTVVLAEPKAVPFSKGGWDSGAGSMDKVGMMYNLERSEFLKGCSTKELIRYLGVPTSVEKIDSNIHLEKTENNIFLYEDGGYTLRVEIKDGKVVRVVVLRNL